MADKLLDRIPDAQDIFGLLRRWSPIRLDGPQGATNVMRSRKGAMVPDGRVVLEDGSLFRADRHDRVQLDLTDPTGRAHAAWWFDAKPWGERRQAAGPVGGTPINPMIASGLLDVARNGADMTPEQIDLLARLVLRLAGRQA